MRFRNLKIAFAILVVCACSKVVIKDIPLYWDAGENGAVQTQLLSDLVKEVDKATWDKQRFGYACLSQDDFAWLRSSLEKACAVSKVACGPEEKKALREFTRRSNVGMNKSTSKGLGDK